MASPAVLGRSSCGEFSEYFKIA